MKTKIALLGLFLLSSNLFSQEFKFPKKIGTSTVGISGTQIMVDRCETSVSDWFSFVYNKYYDSGEGSFVAGFDSLMPDSNLLPEKYHLAIRIFWRLNLPVDEMDLFNSVTYRGINTYQKFDLPLADEEYKYGKHSDKKSFDSTSIYVRLQRILNLPMVGVSYTQVQLYLKWRQDLAMLDDALMKKKYEPTARLMTKEEWAKWATNEGPHKTENLTTQIDTVNSLGCYLLNIKVLVPCKSVEAGIQYYQTGAVTVYGYFPDRLGLYNMFGNVWEMTNEEGIAIGGSYSDFGNVCNASKTVSYTGPQENLGFRCVLELSN